MKKKDVIDFCFVAYEKYQAVLTPLKRKSIYGERKIIPLDSNDEECRRVFYDENDMTLYPKKATGLCKLNEDGTIYEADKNGIQDENEKSKEDELDVLHFSEMTEDFARYYIDYEVEKVYTLQGFDSHAIATLIGEKIFTEKKSDIYRQIWIFQRNGTVFMVHGNIKGEGDYAEKNTGYQIDDQSLVSDISDLDDIDFEMF